ncbi:MAG: ABC transporter permease, partial [Burkholderiales bacterium]|nr:ABC transporter permease [Burkholderiales bacterium]
TKILVVRTITSERFNFDHRTFSLIRNLNWKSASYSEIGILKTFLYGSAFEIINLFQSIATKPTLKSISGTTTQTVVLSFLATLVRDLVLTPIKFTRS